MAGKCSQFADILQLGSSLVDVTPRFSAVWIDPDAQNLAVAVSVSASEVQRGDVIDLESMRKIN